MGKLIRNSEAQQAVKWGIVVGTRESRVHGQGPEEEGGEKGTKVTNEALVGFQGRGCAEVAQPHSCHPFLFEALIFQWS